MSTMAVKVIDRLFLVVYGAAAPDDDEWDRFLRLFLSHGVDKTMLLVLTDGGMPTRTQQQRLDDMMAGCFVPVAIVSESAALRAKTAALSWIVRGLKAFPATDAGLGNALAFLEIPSTRVELIAREAAALRYALGSGDDNDGIAMRR
jgi:hypothetical protein